MPAGATTTCGSGSPIASGRFAACGVTSREIAGRLGSTPKTIETRKARARGRLGINGRARIVPFAILQGWLPGEIPVR